MHIQKLFGLSLFTLGSIMVGLVVGYGLMEFVAWFVWSGMPLVIKSLLVGGFSMIVGFLLMI